jgi:hypothetical protein
LTKLLYEVKNLGVHIAPKSLKIDIRSEKRYLEQCKETFVKSRAAIAKEDALNQDDITALMGDDMMTGIFEGTSTKESKKPPEVMQIEDEYNALTSYDIVLRRGRCGRYFAKYVQKSIFEDSDGGFGSDNEEGDNIEKNILKKRRKRYQDLEEYLNGDPRASNFSGLLMRDQKYLRKNMHKISSLSVKEYATKITKRGGVNNPESLNLENQVSTNSAAAAVFQDYAILGGAISNIDSANGLNNSNLYDFDEGIRKYVKRIFNPVLEIVH